MPEDLPEEQMTRLTEALEKGRKIDAIKIYRSATGLGLKEAKDAVEALHADLHKQFPERFAEPSKSAGCSSSAAMILFVLGGIVYLCATLPA